MKKTCIIMIIVMGVLVLTTNRAQAQQYISQQGRALDANMRIGSYGYNTAVPLDTLIPSGNLYITGNVSGGMRFQGVVPYRSSYEFSAETGSGLLSDFRRDSYGVTQAGYGLTGPQPYLDPSRSVTGVYGGQVGTSAQMMNTGVSPVGAAWRTPAAAIYQRDEMSVRPFSRGFSPLSAGAASPAELAGSLAMPYTGARPRTMTPTEGATALTTPMRRPLETLRQVQEEPADAPTAVQQPPASETPAGEEPMNEGDNLFSWNLLQSLTPAATEQETAAPDDEASEPLGLSGPGLTPSMQAPSSATARVAPSGVSVTPAELDKTQRAFIEKYLQRGKAYQDKGEFYRAADQFNMAAAYAPREPAIYLARCHALLGAGEFLSSAFYLNKALTATVAHAPVAVTTLPAQKVLEDRLADIKRWREQTKDPALLFIQGYVQACLGQADAARLTLQQAKDELPGEPAIDRLLSTLTAGTDAATP